MENILVSVIMGVFNTERPQVLSQAINSVLNQTLTNFEFIICDDGSTDNTYELIKEIANRDSRIVLLRNAENLGLAATLNKCLEVARGSYIARMDADDISAADRFEKEYKFLTEHPEYAFVGCSAYLFADNGIYGTRNPVKAPERKNFLFNSPFIHPSIMIRKEAIYAIDGYRISPETNRTEDYDMFMRLYYHNLVGYNLQDYLYFYREDNQSYKKRKYRYRIEEAIVRYKGFKQLDLLPLGIIYIIKPLLVGVIPQRMLRRYKTNMTY